MQGVGRSLLTKQLMYAADVVDLQTALKQPVKDYSGGMKRRLSLAIALIAKPQLLILDEPTIGIDPALRRQIWQELHRLAKQGVTIILTTHVMADAEEADLLMMIRNGQAIAQGTPKQLQVDYQADSIETVFLAAGGSKMRTEALMIRIFKEMLRDKRTLALMFIAPLFIMTLIFFLFQSNTTTKVDLAVHGVQTSLTKTMDTKHVRLHHVGTEKPTRIIKQHDYAGVLTQHGDQLTLTLANTDQGQSTLLKQTLQAATVKLRLKAAATSLKTQAIALNKLAGALQQATHGAVQVPIPQQPKQTNYRMTTHYRYGSAESTYFDTLLPILIGFIVFFFVF